MKRRTFIQNTAAIAASTLVADKALAATPPLTKKSLKYGMITDKISVLEKFKLIKTLGFDGVELDSPNDLDPNEVLAARDATGIELPGVVNSMHWKYPLSSADPKVQEVCAKSMEKSLTDCKLYGGTTVLLVPGVVNQQISYRDAYERSQDEIKKLIPMAEKTGIKIALENVWNSFLISPLEAARFVDEINHPLVGWYFDVGNVLRYGWPEHWIEVLGKRIMKVDVKEFSRKKQNDEGLWKGFEVELLDGDCNWPVVNRALAKAGYSGWASAEVSGGDANRLRTISQKMDELFRA